MAVAHARLRYDKINVVVTPPGFQAIKNFSVNADSVVRLEITLAAKQLDGAHRAAFKRTGLFFRDGAGPVQVQGTTWLSDQTVKSASPLDIKYSLGPADVSLSVRNSGSIATRWVGYVDRTEVH